MALSEQERKLLEQLEASLQADDPQFADTLSGRGELRVHRRRAALAGLGFVVGLAALLGGIPLHPLVGVAGFAIMVVAAIVGIGAWQRAGEDEPGQRPRTPRPGGPSSPRHDSQEFMDKLEERWRKRQQGGGL